MFRKTGLTVLSLQGNHLTSLPPEIGLLTQLEQLNLYGNGLTTFPPEIGKLTRLELLDAWDNELTSLPEIGGLSSLTDLELYRNRLTSLPPEIGRLQNLERLDVSTNALWALPPEIGGLAPTETVRCGHEQESETVPAPIMHLDSLEELILQLNPIPRPAGRNRRLKRLKHYGYSVCASRPAR